MKSVRFFFQKFAKILKNSVKKCRKHAQNMHFLSGFVAFCLYVLRGNGCPGIAENPHLTCKV